MKNASYILLSMLLGLFVMNGNALVWANEAGLQIARGPVAKANQLKIVRVNKKRGVVTAQVISTGEAITFKTSSTRTRKLATGMVINPSFISQISAKGRCRCGQKGDGSCWCTGQLPCCGPLAGCPIASCGKKSPTNIKPEILGR